MGPPLPFRSASAYRYSGGMVSQLPAPNELRDVRVGFQLVPELIHDRRDVEADPAIVLAVVPPWRGLQIAAGRRRAVRPDLHTQVQVSSFNKNSRKNRLGF
jgi:hypothetical protein